MAPDAVGDTRHVVYRAEDVVMTDHHCGLDTSGIVVPPEDEDFGDDPAQADVVAQIKELIETRVRPAVANDGGDITFQGFKDGVVFLHMRGACSGCPSSTATLRHGIENLLKHFCPDVQEVRPV